jgi:predicted Zn-dependent protease
MESTPESKGAGLSAASEALAVLAHMYLRFGRPREAAILLGAVARLVPDPTPALRTRCVALLEAGHNDAARDEALRLLATGPDDPIRAQLLRIVAKASWRLGDAAQAREYQAMDVVEVIRQRNTVRQT